MTILIATPRCDLVVSIFGCVCANTQRQYANTQIQTRSQRHYDPVHFCPKTKRKWKSNNYSICDLHSQSIRDQWKNVVCGASAKSGICNLAFKHHRKIQNSTLRRSLFALWDYGAKNWCQWVIILTDSLFVAIGNNALGKLQWINWTKSRVGPLHCWASNNDQY